MGLFVEVCQRRQAFCFRKALDNTGIFRSVTSSSLSPGKKSHEHFVKYLNTTAFVESGWKCQGK